MALSPKRKSGIRRESLLLLEKEDKDSIENNNNVDLFFKKHFSKMRILKIF